MSKRAMRQQNRTDSHLQSKGGNKHVHTYMRVMVAYWTIPVFLWATSGSNVFFLISSCGEFLPQSKCQWRKTSPTADVPYSYQEDVHLEQWSVGIPSALFQAIPDNIPEGQNKLPAYIFPSTFMILISIHSVPMVRKCQQDKTLIKNTSQDNPVPQSFLSQV